MENWDVIVVLGVGQGEGGQSQNEERRQEDRHRTGNLLDFTRKHGTVRPGSSDPPEKIFNIFASENKVYTIY